MIFGIRNSSARTPTSIAPNTWRSTCLRTADGALTSRAASSDQIDAAWIQAQIGGRFDEGYAKGVHDRRRGDRFLPRWSKLMRRIGLVTTCTDRPCSCLAVVHETARCEKPQSDDGLDRRLRQTCPRLPQCAAGRRVSAKVGRIGRRRSRAMGAAV